MAGPPHAARGAHSGVPADEPRLTVAVTGPTGTFGFGLMPLLQADERIARVVGVARRRFDPARYGWTKLDYRQGDVRDRDALEQAFSGADVVVHLAFMITGTGARAVTRAINVDGTLNAFHAAAAATAKRFVYASSVAAYGFHADNPVGMTEHWPTRPAKRLFYSRQKAEIERLLGEQAEIERDIGLYLLRPSIVLGPHGVGAKGMVPGVLEPLARMFARVARRTPVRLPAVVPDLRVQFVHERDVGEALRLCILGAGPAGAYNIAGDGVLSATQLARELGFAALPAPPGPAQALARFAAALPFAPPVAQWAEAISHPAIMDTEKAKADLGWRPRYTGLEALRDTLGRLRE
jgi:nucleoside-diphosphate-sugar epimerase